MSKRIVRFSARDTLRLSAVEIKPNGNVVTLGGKNGAGKSSVLNAIQMALGGKTQTPKKPIRDGAEKSEVVLDLGDVVVVRVITATTDKLTVCSKDGAEFRKPQEMLNRLFNSLSFDPLAFIAQKSTDQLQTLKQLVGLDFSKLDQKRALLYQERTEIGRDEKRLKGLLDSSPHFPDAPAKEVSVAELSAELERRLETARKGALLKDELEDAHDAAGEAQESLDGHLAHIEELTDQLKKAKADLPAYKKRVAAALEIEAEANEALASFTPPNTDEVREQIRTAEETNRKVRANAQHHAAQENYDNARQAYSGHTVLIEELDDAKRQVLAEAAFPVPGLSLSEDGVTLDGIPFAQASRAQQLRVSLAIGMSMNPELKVMLVRDAAVLDAEGLGLITEMAEQHDCQVWLEDNRTTDPNAIIIEDGHVQGVATEAAE